MKKRYVFAFILLMILYSAFIISLLMNFSNQFPEKKQTIYGSGFDFFSCEQLTEKDVYDLCLKIYEKDEEEFEAILMTNKFHEHTGPNNVYGAKMGLYAKKLLNGENSKIKVISEAGANPPTSCLNDGIMISIGSSFGRGLIENKANSSKLAASFYYEGKGVRLEVKPEKVKITQDYIANSLKENKELNDAYYEDVRKMGLYVWENFSQEDLFLVEYLED